MRSIGVVGERSKRSEAHAARRGGALRSENVGTSNRKIREIRIRRKPKVSLAMVISQGLVGPKAMAKAAANGQQVNIPAPPRFLMERRRKQKRAHYWICVFMDKNCFPGKSGKQPQGEIRSVEKLLATAGGIFLKSLPRKPSKIRSAGTVP